MLRCRRKENKTKLFCFFPLTYWPTLHQPDMNLNPKHKSVRFCCFTLGQPKWRARKGFHHYESCPRSAINIWLGCKPRLFGGTEAPCDTTWYMVQDTVNILSNHWVWDQADLASTFWKRRMCPNPLKCKFQANLRQKEHYFIQQIPFSEPPEKFKGFQKQPWGCLWITATSSYITWGHYDSH